MNDNEIEIPSAFSARSKCAEDVISLLLLLEANLDTDPRPCLVSRLNLSRVLLRATWLFRDLGLEVSHDLGQLQFRAETRCRELSRTLSSTRHL